MKKIIITTIGITFIAILGIIVYTINDVCRYDSRTNEEYIDILLDNREDFEYVVQAVQQWEGYISFRPIGSMRVQEYIIDDRFYTNNQEIVYEIENNDELYNCLCNIENLDEVYRISIDEDEIMFWFSKYPSGYRGGVSYVEEAKDEFPATKIDEHWELFMIPNV